VESDFALYICYVDKSINIEHYKCYGYSSNIWISQNKKNYNSLVSHCVLNFWDCAMENTPFLSNISDKMKAASSDDSATPFLKAFRV
jgi:hypothetical protein